MEGVTAAAAGALGAASCVNCGAARAGAFCAACGQRAREGRLTLRHVADQVAGELSPVERGFAFTVVAVLRNPGRVAREYAAGRTMRYVGPVKYFGVLAGVAQLLALRLHFVEDAVAGFFDAAFQGAAPSAAQGAAAAFAARYFVSLSAVVVPVCAAWTWLLFRRARLHYAEHAVLALYTGAQQLAALLLVDWLLIERVRVRGLAGVYFLLALAYQMWALRQFTGTSWAQAAWRTVVVAALTVLVASLVIVAGIAALGRL